MKEKKSLEEFIDSLPTPVLNAVAKVLKVEREKLHLKNPIGINDEIHKIIQEESESNETELYNNKEL